MHKAKIYSLCLFTLATTFCFSQALSTKNKKAIKFYTEADNCVVRGQYNQAIKLLNLAIDKEKKFEEAYYLLGAIYRSTGNLLLSCEYFEKALTATPYQLKQKTYFFLLGDNYLRRGLYKDANINLGKFLSLEKTDKPKIDQALVWKSQTEYGLAHKNENLGYKVHALSDTINAYAFQYFPVITADNQALFFVRRLGSTDDDREDIVVSYKDALGNWQPPVSISKNINTVYDEGACSVSADGRHLILTICGQRGCDLYESKKEGEIWRKPVSMGPAVNSSGYETQPSLSADGSELYFVSTRKGGLGGHDIWYSKKDSTGAWVKAVNLGKTVNTKYDEVAPFIHVNNRNLYFASNGRPGFGGYDFYVSEKDQRQWQEPKNMGAPLNDFKDQYSFLVTSDGENAYYTLEERFVKSKIYQTNIPKDLQVRSRGNVVKGVVTDSKTQKPLHAEVELFDLKSNEKISVFASDSVNGRYLIVIPGKSEYALHVAEPGYLFYSLHFNYEEKDQDQPIVIDIALQSIVKNATTILNNIFFDFNQSEIKPRSLPELDEVVKFLNTNPTIKVEISGHTDNVGNENYNQQLSLKRAQSVVDYFLLKGIARTRLTQIGYGSKKPIRPNDTEENKQENRRIEFRIE